jgi:hypothetical protein
MLVVWFVMCDLATSATQRGGSDEIIAYFSQTFGLIQAR